MVKYIASLLLLFLFFSCEESNKDRITRLVKEWDGKEIAFPENMIFTRLGSDTLDYQMPESDYTVVSYIDSVGCTSCKLQFHRWRAMMYEMDSLSNRPIPFLFIFHPKNKRDLSELSYLMKRDKFDYPVWIDVEDRFNKQNGLPTENILHAFLIDKQNKVVAIGDPFQNPKIKDLYLSILNEDSRKEKSNITTHVSVEQPSVDLGRFDWTVAQTVDFKLKNQGEKPLVINDVVASCGCISVDYPKQPIAAGKDALIKITYKAEKPEYVNKILMVYANIESAVRLTVKGNAN